MECRLLNILRAMALRMGVRGMRVISRWAGAAAFSTSFLRILPSWPVPDTAERSTPFTSAYFFASAVALTAPLWAAASTSLARTSPAGPLAVTAASSTPFSAASFLA